MKLHHPALAELCNQPKKSFQMTTLFRPRALAVDPIGRRLFWSDTYRGTFTISSRSELNNWHLTSHFQSSSSWLDGTGREVVVEGRGQEPFGLAVHEHHIYWTDWTTYSVYRVGPKTLYACWCFLSNESKFRCQRMGCKVVLKELRAFQIRSHTALPSSHQNLWNAEVRRSASAPPPQASPQPSPPPLLWAQLIGSQPKRTSL